LVTPTMGGTRDERLEFTLDAPGGLMSQVETPTAVTTPPSRGSQCR
jgi:hypothetical protein